MIEVFTVKELASLLKVTPNIIYQMAKNNKLPYFRVGNKSGTIRFKRQEIEEYFGNQRLK